MRQVSARRRKRDAGYGKARLQVFDRADGLCEAMVADGCTGMCEQVHHRAGRGGDTPHRLDNLVGLCLPCHDWVGANRTAALELGLLVRRNGVGDV